MLNGLDSTTIVALNGFAGRSRGFDSLMEFLVGSYLVKGAIFVSIFWWFWFQSGSPEQVRRSREHVVCTMVGSVFAIAVARLLALSLPFRIRPRYEPSLHFHSPAETSPGDLMDWSSFPSDHAVMFAALAVGISFISRRAGLLASLYFLVLIAFPRMYLGFHYPTDILAGVAVGAVVGFIFNARGMCKLASASALTWEHDSPRYFYMAFFILCFQMATMFESLRDVALAGTHFVRRLLI